MKQKYKKNMTNQKYKHELSTIQISPAGEKFVQSRDNKSKTSQSLPSEAEPGDKTYVLIRNKSIRQVREYNELTSEASKDIDIGHDHGFGDPHIHYWPNGKRDLGNPISDEDKQYLEDLKKVEIKDSSSYYPINEDIARAAHHGMYFSDYKEDSETLAYKEQVDDVFDIADAVKNKYKDDESTVEVANKLADSYAKKLADWTNKKNRLILRYPSPAVVGPAGYTESKLNKRDEAFNSLYKEYEQIEQIKKKITNLRPKINREKQGHVNNNVDLSNKYFEVIQNESENRLQLKFENKPNYRTIKLLKSNGFKWSPKNQVWQRQLTANARYSTKLLIEELDKSIDN